MFTTTGSRGLDKAPLSKGLLLVLSGLTVVLTLLPQYHHLFTYSLQAITQQQQSFLFGTWVLTALMDFLLAEAFHYLFDYQVAELPAGL
ncbi:unnamed protein product [Coregonus sp. 'balchen']|nr:unnamed protein product [Coregonus sp. 'balchen']